MIFTHDITLDITFNKIETITLKQYTQNSHILHITLTNKGVPFPADKNLSCYFKMLTPDGKHIFTDGSIHEDGTIRVLIPETACLTAGDGKAELVLSGPVNESASDASSENESVFLTMEFNVHIAASVYDHAAITSSDDFSALTTALRKANETYENVMENAQKSADTSSAYAALSETYAHGQTGTREGEDTDNAMYYKTKAQEYASAAADCKADVTNTKTQIDETAATIHTLRDEASSARDEANSSSQQAKTHAGLSMSYAVGTGGVIREGDTVDNAKYYKEQAERISAGLAGALLPMGTITFDILESQSKQPGYMYNISDRFTTTEAFKEGSGHAYPPGTNVYYTADDHWDCLAGIQVTGIKGDNETDYRRGYVNLTPEDIGALPVDGDSKNNTVTFAQAGQRANISSGEKLSSIFGKIMKFFFDLKTVAFSGSYNDLSDTPSSLPANGGYADSAGSVAWASVSGKPSTYTPSSHTHDERYYTETEINTKLSNMASHYRLTNKTFSIGGNGSVQVEMPYTIPSGYAISGVLEVRSTTSAAVLYGYDISELTGSGTFTVYLGNRSTNAQTGSVVVNLGISKISF